MPKSKKRKKPSSAVKSPATTPPPKRVTPYQQQIDTGIAAFQSGDMVAAENSFLAALEIEPENAVGHNLMGVVALACNAPEIAVTYLRQAASLDGRIADFHYNLALALQEIGAPDDAVHAVKQALEIKPDYAVAWNTLGQILLGTGDYQGSVAALNKAIAYQSDMGEAWVNLCGAYQEQNEHAKAQDAGKRGCDLRADLPQAHYNLARAYDGEKRWEEAIVSYQKALELEPDFLKAHINISRCFTKGGDALRGEEAALKALKLAPDNGEAHNNLGTALLDQGRYRESLASLRKSVTLDPHAPEAHNNLGHALLVLEEFDEGWVEYEYGFQTGDRGPLTITPAPVWNGEPLSGKTIHVYGEQGVGEQVMFSTMLEDVRAAGATIIYECEERLVPMFARSMPWVKVVPISDTPHPDLMQSEIDYRVSVGSLGRWFRTSTGDFTPRGRFLQPDPDLVSRYRETYRNLGDGLTVGVSWKSNSPNHAERKNIPIELWEPVLTQPNCHFVSLQYGDVDADIAKARDTLGVDVYVDDTVSALNSLEQSAAQAASVDLVISISNATVHLSGACGQTTWVLLGEKPLWHWFLEREASLWYETVSLHRQEMEGDWSPLMRDIGNRLAVRAAADISQ